MRLEQREAIAAAITPTPRTRVNIAAVIEAIEAAGYTILAPDEPLISGVAVLSGDAAAGCPGGADRPGRFAGGRRAAPNTDDAAGDAAPGGRRYWDLGLRIVSTTRADKAGARHGGAN